VPSVFVFDLPLEGEVAASLWTRRVGVDVCGRADRSSAGVAFAYTVFALTPTRRR
jgi:hypothetical protein